MNHWVKALRRIALASGIAAAITLGLLAANALASRAADPVPPTRIDELTTRLKLDPANEKLKEELRRQDLYLREQVVRSRRFATSGFFILLGFTAAFLASLKVASALSRRPPMPDPAAPKKVLSDLALAERGVVAMALTLGGVLCSVATLSRHDTVAGYADQLQMPGVAGKRPAASKEPEGQPLAVLPPPVASTPPTAAAPPALVGNLSPAPGGTELVPMPVEPPPVSRPSAPAPDPKTTVRATPAETNVWPGLRGPSGDGVAVGPLPKAWDVVWKTPVDLPGHGSAAVWGERAFLSGATEGERAVFSFSIADGKQVWRTPVPKTPQSGQVKPEHDTGFAPASVAVDANRVVAMFVDGDCVGLDHDGNKLWQRSFGKLENPYGHASSPVFAGGWLILQMDQGSSPDAGKSRLLALDPATGKTVWEAKRPTSVSWATPLVLKVGARTLIVTNASPCLVAHDARDGKEVWRSEGMSGEVAPSLAADSGMVFAANLGAALMAVRADDGKQVWTSYDAAMPDISSPVAHQGLLFLSAPDGTLSCLDVKDGKILWEQKMPKPAQASPVVVGGQGFLLGIDGVLRVFEAGRTYKALGEHPLGEAASATPAFVGGRVYVRTRGHLVCLGAK